ncbi:MAG: vWA domain-containing protein, partial [Planctomycetota bacterium]
MTPRLIALVSIFRRHRAFVGLVACAAVFSLARPAKAEPVDTDASIRIVSHSAGDQTYVAAAIQPGAAADLVAAVTDSPLDLVVVMDMSASQVGSYRDDAMTALTTLLSSLDLETTRVQLFAADVRALALTDRWTGPTSASSVAAVHRLRARLPLGNTNLNAVLETVRAPLAGTPATHQRAIVYIGDGASIDGIQNISMFENVVDALRADRTSVHSIAVGPTTNIETLAILANQTGGVFGAIGDDETVGGAKVIATQIAAAVSMSPLWTTSIQCEGVQWVHADRLPPLRLDRDSILLGRFSLSGSSKSDQLALSLESRTPMAEVTVTATADVEPSHPDFAFLPGLLSRHASRDGLCLPTAGSSMLMATAQAMAGQAQALARASSMALQQGNRRGAAAVAKMALEADPENPDAKTVFRLTETAQRLVMQNADDSPFDDLFGDAAPSADAPAADMPEDPFGGAPADDPFGEPAADDPFGGPAPAPAAPAVDDPFGAPAPIEPPPAPAAPAPML